MTHTECQVWSFAGRLQAKVQWNCILLNSGISPFTTSCEEALFCLSCQKKSLKKKIVATVATNIRRAVSFVQHQCSATCHFEEGPTPVLKQSCILCMTLVTICIAIAGTVYCLHRFY